MDIVQLLIENLGMMLAIANQTMSQWMVIPFNATGPLDPDVTLTSEGFMVVSELSNAAIGLSNILAEALEILF
jgi:hypothetical protein